MEEKLLFKDATKEDLFDITVIEKEGFSDNWSYDSFNSCLTNPFCETMGAFLDDKIIAYGILMHMYEQGEIVKICVSRDYKRRGVGYELLRRMLLVAEDEGVEKVFLDVRESNDAAIKLYEKTGFSKYDTTRDFYSNPTEASIKMRFNFTENDNA